MNPTGQYFLDGMDFWTNFSMIVESGSDDFIKFPDRKDSITHDWLDSNGLDVDLTRVTFKDRNIVLKMAIIVSTPEEFWLKRNAFLAQWSQPGTHRLTSTELGQSFYVFYKSCGSFSRFTRLQNTNKIACKFTITVNEPGPTFDNNDVFLVDDDGRAIVV
jgi:hypothetical protein